MSRRLAHRPRYRNFRHLSPPPLPTRKSFIHTRWTYRQQTITNYQKRPLGQGLLSITFPRFVHSIMVRWA